MADQKENHLLTQIEAGVERLPAWLPPLLILVSIAACAIAFLLPAPVEFPVDDAYIHMVYAQNLAEHGRLFFNFPGETGVGTSSILWVLLLAAGGKAGIPMYVVAKVLGVSSLGCIGIFVYLLFLPVWRIFRSLVAALLVVLSGNMLWFSLNGMETTLFFGLGLLVILLYRAERWGWTGVSIGLLVLTRPDGFFLLAALGLIDVFAARKLRRGFLIAVLVAVLICAPWFGYLEMRTGQFLPTSAAGKQGLATITTSHMLDQNNLPRILGSLNGLVYIGLWLGNMVEFGLGGASLPAPYLVPLEGIFISVWLFPAIALALWMIVRAWRKLWASNPLRSSSLADPIRRSIILLLVWVSLHNLVYMLYLPRTGTGGRYGAVNYLILWAAISGGLFTFVNRQRLQSALLACVVFVAACNSAFWNRVYDANIEFMVKARIAAAQYVVDTFPDDEVCAAVDIGAMRYFSQRPVVDLGGLVDAEFVEWFRNNRVDEYLSQHHTGCLILPGQMGDQSRYEFDAAEILGVAHSPLFNLERMTSFAITRDRWLLGNLPTGNYLSSVTIYRLVPAK